MPQDIIYYSNYCEHSKKLLQFIVKNNLIESLTCFNIDKRTRDVHNNQMFLILDNGQKVSLPPTVNSVPALLCVNNNYVVLSGYSKIVEYLEPFIKLNAQSSSILANENEPISYRLESYTANSNIVSEKFTDYNAPPDILSAKGVGKDRNLHNYVGVDTNIVINTPEDKYKPDKISSDVTIDKLSQLRNESQVESLYPVTSLPPTISR